MRYAAFLRAINVGKHNRIRMEELRNLCSSLGWDQITTHLQTGNIAFENDQPEGEVIAQELEATLIERGFSGAAVIVRSDLQIRQLLEREPFANHDANLEYRYVTLLRQPSQNLVGLPTDLKIVFSDETVICSSVAKNLTKPIQINAVIERAGKTPATTRFVNVLEDFAKLL
jgi:uncharacterized protein (DUF1697 family)